MLFFQNDKAETLKFQPSGGSFTLSQFKWTSGEKAKERKVYVLLGLRRTNLQLKCANILICVETLRGELCSKIYVSV